MDLLFGTLEYLGDPTYWLAVLAGLTLATVAGILPGISSPLIMAVTFPFIILNIDDPAIGIVLLATIGGTSNTFDSIPAQFFGIVSSGTQVTFLEGHQLTRKGQGAYSMGAVYAVSAIGGVVGALALLVVIPFIRPFVVSFSFSDIAMVAFFGLGMVAILSRGAMAKGLASACLGLLLATVGLQSFSGAERYTLGIYDLATGIPLVPAVLGLMALPEMIDLAVNRSPVAGGVPGGIQNREVFRGFRYGLSRWRMAIRQSLIGVGLGAIPGMGASVITWIAYAVGMVFTKDRSQFGKGSLDGLLFAESAENAKEGGQAIPTLALGVPGSVGWLLILVALLSYGIGPGPDLLTNHADIVGLIVVTFALGNLILTILGLFVTRWIVKLTFIPYPAIAAVTIPVVILGAYFGDSTLFILPVILGFTALGLIMKGFGWPRPPLVLALVLGPIIESNLWSGINVYGVVGVATRPLTVLLFLVSIATVVFLHVMMSRADATREDVVKRAGALENEAAPVPRTRESRRQLLVRRRPRLYRRRSHLVPIAVILVGVLAAWEATNFSSDRASLLPLVAATGVILFGLLHLLSQVTRSTETQGEIMDLGLLSTGTEGARSASLLVAGVAAASLVVLVVAGLQYAGLIFAFALPMVLMNGRRRWLTSIIATVIVFAFTFGVGDALIHVIWPDGLIEIFGS